MIHIGFSGSHYGMKTAQTKSLELWFMRCRFGQENATAHHGMCEGADDQFHYMFRMKWLGNRFVVGHPPSDQKKMAKIPEREFDELREPKDFLVRNHDIVDEVKAVWPTCMMLFTPASMTENLRSGTWATYRYAKKCVVPYWLFLPDGSVQVSSGAERWVTK